MKPVTITMKDYKIVDTDFVQWIRNEIADKAFTRQHVADTYAILLQKPTPYEVFVEINHAIIARWSPSALRWIKEQAWKKVEQSAAGG